MFSMMSLFPFMYLLYILIPLGPLVYIFIKWWSNRESKSVDPNLGIKVTAYYFKTLGYHISLIGISLILIDLIKGDFNSNARIGAGILICGVLVYLFHFLIIKKFFNDPEFMITKKVYNTFNLIFVGLAGTISMIILMVIIMGKKADGFEFPSAFLIVYMIAWTFQAWFFYKPLFKKEK